MLLILLTTLPVKEDSVIVTLFGAVYFHGTFSDLVINICVLISQAMLVYDETCYHSFRAHLFRLTSLLST